MKHVIQVHSSMYNKKDLLGFLQSAKWQERYARKKIAELQKEIRSERKGIRHYKALTNAYEKALAIHSSEGVSADHAIQECGWETMIE